MDRRTDDMRRNWRVPPGRQTNADGSLKYPQEEEQQQQLEQQKQLEQQQQLEHIRQLELEEAQRQLEEAQRQTEKEIQGQEDQKAKDLVIQRLQELQQKKASLQESLSLKDNADSTRKTKNQNPLDQMEKEVIESVSTQPKPKIQTEPTGRKRFSNDNRSQTDNSPESIPIENNESSIIPTAYAEESTPEDFVKPAPSPTYAKSPIKNTNNSRTHNPNVTYLDENKNAISVGGIPLEAKNQTEQQEPTINQRVDRVSRMIGVKPSMHHEEENVVTDFVEGLAAPIENYGIMVQNQFSQKRKTVNDSGKRFGNKSVPDEENSPEPIPYKETLLDNTISGKQPTRSPAYYFGTAVSDAALIAAPIPETRAVTAARTAVIAAKNLKSAKIIAKATAKKGIVQNLEQAGKFVVKEGENIETTTKIPRKSWSKMSRREKLVKMGIKGSPKQIGRTSLKKVREIAEKHRYIMTKNNAPHSIAVKKVTHDHYTVSRGTMDNPARIPYTTIDFSRQGLTKNIKAAASKGMYLMMKRRIMLDLPLQRINHYKKIEVIFCRHWLEDLNYEQLQKVCFCS